MAAPAVVKVAQRFKAGLLAGERAHQLEMARRYLSVERALADKITVLAEQVTRMAAQGKDIPIGRIYRLERWRELDAALLRELAGFNSWTLDAIGARQAELAQMGVVQAQELLRAAGITGTFDALGADAVMAMVGYAGDGSPLSALLAEAYPATVDAIGGELVKGVALGLNPKVTARNMRNASSIGLDRAFLVARTEELRSFRTASQAQYIAAGVTRYQRIASLDDRACIGCLAADGEVFETEQTFDDHPACLLPGTDVLATSVLAATRARYEGPAVEIRTRLGRRITVTPQHMVLTRRGWVAAQSLKQGDELVSSGPLERVARCLAPDDDDMPAVVEDVFAALAMTGGVRSVSVPSSPEQFHGDGRSLNGKVDIVWSDRLLKRHSEATLGKASSYPSLGLGRVAPVPLLAASAAGEMPVCQWLAAHSVMRRLSDAAASLCAHRRHAQDVSLTATTPRNAERTQTSGYHTAGHSVSTSEGLLRLAAHVPRGQLVKGQRQARASCRGGALRADGLGLGRGAAHAPSVEDIREALVTHMTGAGGVVEASSLDVHLDRVVDLTITRHTGHVYDLQTPDGWYLADGIVVHNCRCTAAPILPEQEPFQSRGEDWFNQQDEATQEQIMGPGRLELYDSGAASWSDMWTRVDDPIWGGAVVPANVGDLVGA